MKALILAGGAGTRLRPITHTRAKQLVPVANTPILFYGLEAMVAAGITEVGVIIGDTGEEIRDAVGDGSRFGAKVTYLPQEAPLGLAHCVLIAKDFLGDDDFVMYLGDNLLEQDLGAFVEAFEAARESRRPRPPRSCSSRSPIRSGSVSPPSTATATSSGWTRSRTTRRRTSRSSACTCSTRSIHEAVRAIEPSDRGELEITDAIQWLIDHGHRVRTELLTGWWIDTGKLTPLLEANRLLLEQLDPRIDGEVDATSTIDGRVVVEEDAEIVNSIVRGPVAIGRGTRIVDSFIGPFSAIGAGCEIVGSEIEHSVVMDDSKVLHIPRLEDSLIGREALVTRTSRRPRSLRLMVGDHCQVDVE